VPTPTSVDVTAPVLAHHEIDIKAPMETVWALHVDVNGWMSCHSCLPADRTGEAPGNES
jgi:hypothetical protein